MSTNRRTLLAAASAPLALNVLAAPATLSDDEVATLVDHATRGHVALMQGDIATYRAHLRAAPDCLLMSPFGGKPSPVGRLSDERWAQIGSFFRDGHDSTFELVQAWRSPDLVVLAAIERSHVAVGEVPAQQWDLRVTVVFRRDEGRWQLVHRHADALAGGISVAQAATLARTRTESAA